MDSKPNAPTPEPIIGIDLGTTFSLAAVMTPTGPVVIRDADGRSLVPSVVAFAADGKVSIGTQARAHAVENPLSTVYSVKRLMGKGIRDVEQDMKFLPYALAEGPGDTVRVRIGEAMLSPEELSAMILMEVRQRAERALGRTIAEAVITVPAYFDDAQRQATRNAGRLAGLEVRRIVNEPTAAALAYGLDRKGEATIAVYDLGGGTFDVSVLRCSGGVFQVLATNGDTHLGGDDLDLEIIDLITTEIRQQFGQHLVFGPATRQAMRDLAEAAKIRLSTAPSADVEISLGQDRLYRRTISREEFESRAARWIDHTLEHCRNAMDDAALRPDQIDEVVMVGGCTRIPLVLRRVEEYFGRKPYTAINPDEVVAMGAAVQAGILAGQERGTLLLDVTPLSLGIETLGGAMGKLIMRNSTIPCQASETFTTYVDGQTSVDIHVLQGERELAADCRSLGRFQLRGVPPMPANMPRVLVTFLIDANGILNVSARELRSGREASVQIVPSHGLAKADVDRMVKDSYAHAVADMTAHRLIDTRNEARRIIDAIAKSIANAPGLLTAVQKADLDRAVAELEARINQDDPDILYEAMQAANAAAAPLTESQMDQVLRQTVKGKKLEEF